MPRSSDRLTLSVFETKTTQFMFLPVDGETLKVFLNTGSLPLGATARESNVWSAMLQGDLTLLISPEGERLRILACRVSGKGFTQPDSVSEKRFTIDLEVLGTASSKGVTPAALFPKDTFAVRSSFQPVWELCSRVSTPSAVATPWSHSEEEYVISTAQTKADIHFIADVAKHHPFGFTDSFVALIARQQEKRVGAVLLAPAWYRDRSHTAAWRIFHDDYVWIREHAVEILRLYSIHSVSRWRVHRVLLKASAEIAHHIARRPLSIIEGVSYDFHPVAEALGYFVEVPRKVEGSFYYWKPFTLPAGYDRVESAERYADVRSRAHAVLALRREIGYWLLKVQPDRLEQALARGSWALRRGAENAGNWRQVRPGHRAFLMTPDGVVRAAGTVRITELRHVDGLQSFPFWMDFEETSIASGVDIDISRQLAGHWFSRLGGGGIVPLTSELGAAIDSAIHVQLTEGKMWVHPNPYLLHKTDFNVVSRQIFVVQSAALSHTVLPVIRGILEPLNYKVKYWGDRGGQLVFEDIWLLLNESEAVIVDFTEKRPNVYLEYGMALVLGKPVIGITQRMEDIPSNTPTLKYIVYNDKLGDTALREKLPRAIGHTIADLEEARMAHGRVV